MSRLFYVLLTTALLAGCASNQRIEDLTSEQRARALSIQIYEKAPDRAYKIMSTVTGLSCNRNKYQAQDISDQEGVEGLKIQAVILGADAVINTFCQRNSDTDWRNNCWASVKCIGDAVKFE